MRAVLSLAALGATIAIGLWLLAAPFVIEMDRPAAVSHLVTGPIVASVATIALALVARPVARLNAVLGAWLIVAPLALDHGDWWPESVVAGLLIAALAFVPRGDPARFGGGWRSLFEDPAAATGTEEASR
jgi:hypothetical protein